MLCAQQFSIVYIMLWYGYSAFALQRQYIASRWKFGYYSINYCITSWPCEADKTCLQGIDSDGDGVRPILWYIALTYPNSEKTRKILTQYAKATQATLLDVNNKGSSIPYLEGTVLCTLLFALNSSQRCLDYYWQHRGRDAKYQREDCYIH